MFKLIKENGLWIFPSELRFRILSVGVFVVVVVVLLLLWWFCFCLGFFWWVCGFLCFVLFSPVCFQQQQIWTKFDLYVAWCTGDYINISVKNCMQTIAHLSWGSMYLSLSFHPYIIYMDYMIRYIIYMDDMIYHIYPYVHTSCEQWHCSNLHGQDPSPDIYSSENRAWEVWNLPSFQSTALTVLCLHAIEQKETHFMEQIHEWWVIWKCMS